MRREFYDRRPHTTVDGRIVYDRKRHPFTQTDILRIQGKVSGNISLDDEKKILTVCSVALSQLVIARSQEPGAFQNGYGPITEIWPWWSEEIRPYLLKLAGYALISKGDPEKFRLAIENNV